MGANINFNELYYLSTILILHLNTGSSNEYNIPVGETTISSSELFVTRKARQRESIHEWIDGEIEHTQIKERRSLCAIANEYLPEGIEGIYVAERYENHLINYHLNELKNKEDDVETIQGIIQREAINLGMEIETQKRGHGQTICVYEKGEDVKNSGMRINCTTGRVELNLGYYSIADRKSPIQCPNQEFFALAKKVILEYLSPQP